MMKKMMMIIRINDKDGEFGGMLEDWTFGLLLYLTYENLFESGGQIQITDATQSHHIARQTLGTTNLLVLIDRDITEGIALKLQQPKNDSSASTNNPRLRIIDYIVCAYSAHSVYFFLHSALLSSSQVFFVYHSYLCSSSSRILFFLYSLHFLHPSLFFPYSPVISSRLTWVNERLNDNPKSKTLDVWCDIVEIHKTWHPGRGCQWCQWWPHDIVNPQVLVDSTRLRLKVAGGIVR